MPIDPQEDPPIQPGKPSEPPQESPAGNPRPEIPPPMQDPGEAPTPEEAARIRPHARRVAGARTARTAHPLSNRCRDRRFAGLGARSRSGHTRFLAGDNVKVRFETIV